MGKEKSYKIKLIISTPIEDSTVINEMVLQAVLDTGCKVEFMCLQQMRRNK